MLTSPQQIRFRSVTQKYHPKLRKNYFQPLPNIQKVSSQHNPQAKDDKGVIEQAVCNNFNLLNSYLLNLQNLFNKRMFIHEEEIISIAHSEIKKIKQQSRKIIEEYSNLIKEKMINKEILDLKYEIKYYQQRACELFQENKALCKQNKKLRRDMQLGEDLEMINHKVMKNISKKYMKEKILRRNAIQNCKTVNGQLQKSQQKLILLCQMEEYKHEATLIDKSLKKYNSLSKDETRDNNTSAKQVNKVTPKKERHPFFYDSLVKYHRSLIIQKAQIKPQRIKTQAQSKLMPRLSSQND